MPKCAKHDHKPHVLWIALPTHKYFGQSNNRKRERQSEILSTTVKVHDDMSVLKMVKEWDPDNSNFYIYDSDRFTSEGLYHYWASVDSAIHYWDVAIHPKIGRPRQKVGNKFRKNDRFHWKHSNFEKRRRCLPTPT